MLTNYRRKRSIYGQAIAPKNTFRVLVLTGKQVTSDQSTASNGDSGMHLTKTDTQITQEKVLINWHGSSTRSKPTLQAEG